MVKPKSSIINLGLIFWRRPRIKAIQEFHPFLTLLTLLEILENPVGIDMPRARDRLMNIHPIPEVGRPGATARRAGATRPRRIEALNGLFEIYSDQGIAKIRRVGGRFQRSRIVSFGTRAIAPIRIETNSFFHPPSIRVFRFEFSRDFYLENLRGKVGSRRIISFVSNECTYLATNG